MLKIIISILISIILVGCAPQEIQMAPDGKPVPKIYDMRAQSTARSVRKNKMIGVLIVI